MQRRERRRYDGRGRGTTRTSLGSVSPKTRSKKVAAPPPPPLPPASSDILEFGSERGRKSGEREGVGMEAERKMYKERSRL